MRLNGKLAVDHYIGGPVAWTLNIFARFVGSLWKRDHSLKSEPRSILFLKFLGFGSIVRASFLIAAAKRRYPKARIVFATFPGCAHLVHMYPEVDEVVVVRDSSLLALGLDTLKLLLVVWRRRVDLVIDLEVHSKFSSIVSGLTLARDRAGFGGITSRFRTSLYTHLVYWNPMRRIDYAYDQLGAALGLERNGTACVPQIKQRQQDELEAYLARREVSPDHLLLGINPNASDLRNERRWPKEHFANFISALPPSPLLRIMLVGSAAERAYVEEIHSLCDHASNQVINTAGELSFGAFAALVKRCNLFVTNDSGPLHLACAYAVPTISLWGPTHPAVYGPKAPQHVILYRPIYCSPCAHLSDRPPCGGDNRCLKDIAWQRVVRMVAHRLGLNVMPRLVSAQDQRTLEPLPRRDARVVLGLWQREREVGTGL